MVRDLTGAGRLDDTGAEERRLWADLYDVLVRVVEIVRTEDPSVTVLQRVAGELTQINTLLARIKEISGTA